MIKKFLKSQKLVIFITGTHGSTAHYMYSTSRFFFVFVSFRFGFFCSKFYKIVINYHLVSMRVFRQVPQTFELCYTNQVIIKLPQLFVFLSEKPVIKIKSPQPSSVIEGSTLYLDCVATGFPRPRVTWVRIRDGQVLQNRTNDEATSLVRNFTKCDEGEYRCTAKNRLGSENYTLQVIVIGEFLLCRSEMKGTLYIYIYTIRERAVFYKSCDLIGSESGHCPYYSYYSVESLCRISLALLQFFLINISCFVS